MSRSVLPTLAVALLSALLLRGQVPAVRVYRAWTKGDVVDAAAVHAGGLTEAAAAYARYVDLSAVAPDARGKALQVLGFVVNSWSRYDRLAPVRACAGTEGALAWFSLADLRDTDDAKGLAQLVRAFDDLGRTGSGPSPFPEPYFHSVIRVKDVSGAAADTTETYTERVRKKTPAGEEYTVWDRATGAYVPEYETVTRTRVVKGAAKAAKNKDAVALAGHLNRATAAGLALVTGSQFPVFEYHWLLYNGLVEPRYHELLGLDDTLASAKKLAAVDDALADKAGSKLRGAVLFSEVAHHNRLLERSPSQHRNGRGSFWASLDFATSIDLKDVLKDVLNEAPDAGEFIFTLPNGLHGYLVADGKGKRLDKADGDVANNKRSRFRDTQVRTAYHCVACHLPDKGWIPVEDEVRELAKKSVTLVADAFDKKDRARGERLRRLYLEDDVNDLLASDQLVLDQAVKRATGGLQCGEVARVVTDAIWSYLEAPVTADRLARETGYPREALEAAVRTPGVDPVFAVIAAGRKGRRDQVERGFNQVAVLLREQKAKAQK